jgi:hypothetical protein
MYQATQCLNFPRGWVQGFNANKFDGLAGSLSVNRLIKAFKTVGRVVGVQTAS